MSIKPNVSPITVLQFVLPLVGYIFPHSPKPVIPNGVRGVRNLFSIVTSCPNFRFHLQGWLHAAHFRFPFSAKPALFTQCAPC